MMLWLCQGTSFSHGHLLLSELCRAAVGQPWAEVRKIKVAVGEYRTFASSSLIVNSVLKRFSSLMCHISLERKSQTWFSSPTGRKMVSMVIAHSPSLCNLVHLTIQLY